MSKKTKWNKLDVTVGEVQQPIFPTPSANKDAFERTNYGGQQQPRERSYKLYHDESKEDGATNKQWRTDKSENTSGFASSSMSRGHYNVPKSSEPLASDSDKWRSNRSQRTQNDSNMSNIKNTGSGYQSNRPSNPWFNNRSSSSRNTQTSSKFGIESSASSSTGAKSKFRGSGSGFETVVPSDARSSRFPQDSSSPRTTYSRFSKQNLESDSNEQTSSKNLTAPPSRNNSRFQNVFEEKENKVEKDNFPSLEDATTDKTANNTNTESVKKEETQTLQKNAATQNQNQTQSKTQAQSQSQAQTQPPAQSQAQAQPKTQPQTKAQASQQKKPKDTDKTKESKQQKEPKTTKETSTNKEEKEQQNQPTTKETPTPAQTQANSKEQQKKLIVKFNSLLKENKSITTYQILKAGLSQEELLDDFEANAFAAILFESIKNNKGLTFNNVVDALFDSPILKSKHFLILILELMSSFHIKSGPGALVYLVQNHDVIDKYFRKIESINSDKSMKGFREYGLEYIFPVSIDENKEIETIVANKKSLEESLSILSKYCVKDVNIYSNYITMNTILKYILTEFYFSKIRQNNKTENIISILNTLMGNLNKNENDRIDNDDNKNNDATDNNNNDNNNTNANNDDNNTKKNKKKKNKNKSDNDADNEKTKSDNKNKNNKNNNDNNDDNNNNNNKNQKKPGRRNKVNTPFVQILTFCLNKLKKVHKNVDDEDEDTENGYCILMIIYIVNIAYQISNDFDGLLPLMKALESRDIVPYRYFRIWQMDDNDKLTEDKTNALSKLSEWLFECDEREAQKQGKVATEENPNEESEDEEMPENIYVQNLLAERKHKHDKYEHMSFFD